MLGVRRDFPLLLHFETDGPIGLEVEENRLVLPVIDWQTEDLHALVVDEEIESLGLCRNLEEYSHYLELKLRPLSLSRSIQRIKKSSCLFLCRNFRDN